LHNPSLKFAVSTWSVHKLLGVTYANGPADRPDSKPRPTFGTGIMSLLELPSELKRREYTRAEICHFHLASCEPSYLKIVRDAFQASGVEIQTLLIDDGDLTHPQTRARDLAWMTDWIAAAGILGAGHARVIAGKDKPSPQALALSIDGLKKLARSGKEQGVRIVTENWFELLSSSKHVHHVLDAMDGDIGFLADMGNWQGPQKYDELKSVFARAELCHAKCEFSSGLRMNADDYERCLRAASDAGYACPFTLIFESDGDEWRGLDLERRFIEKTLSISA
jgi:Xylose isomerase-like TIM barrel